MSGKGDAYRPHDKARYDEGWERAFGEAAAAAEEVAPENRAKRPRGLLPAVWRDLDENTARVIRDGLRELRVYMARIIDPDLEDRSFFGKYDYILHLLDDGIYELNKKASP